MTDVTARTTIALEIDDTDLRADIPRAQALFLEFVERMERAANITPRIDFRNINGQLQERLIVDIDPRTTTAGMEVIQNIVRDYTSRIRREAHVNIGVDTTEAPRAFARLRKLATETSKGITDAFAFTISRGIENALQYLV